MKKQIQNGPDVVALMTKMQEQLAALDRKVDSLINKLSAQSVKPSVQPPVNTNPQGGGRPNDQHKARTMHRATCADCKNECEIPFKPSGDRPVYCKECFSRRKKANAVKVFPNEAPPAPAVIHAAPELPAKKKKPASVKKPVVKKKIVVKKKK